jgi:hypothetical protein
MNPSHALARQKVQAGITTLAWVSAAYFKINPKWVDADDYIQTMIVFESLVAKKGFDHADLVARYRVERPTSVCGVRVKDNGVEHEGQIHRLKQDPNPLYKAKTGYTPGCAMKAMPLGVWNREFHPTIFMADAVTSVTHGTDEARLIGLLAALRYRHALLEIDDPDRLVTEWTSAAKMLGLFGSAAWLRCDLSVQRARRIVKETWGTEALRRLLSRVGLMYFAWSCPVSAIFWSYALDPAFKNIFMHVGSDKKFSVGGERILVDKDVLDEYAGHLKLHAEDGKRWLEEPEKTGRQDSDTFFSIAFSIAAVRAHDFLTREESVQTLNDIGRENWVPVLDAIEERWQ